MRVHLICSSFLLLFVLCLLIKCSDGFAPAPYQRRSSRRMMPSSLDLSSGNEDGSQLSLKQKLTADMKAAMKAKDKERLAAVRGIQAAIKQKEVDDQKPVTDDDVIGIMSKLMKQRKESIKSYSDSGRDDLAASEQFEYDVIVSYMPAQLTAEEVQKIVDDAISKVGASSIKDMGKVMGTVRPQLVGKADMAEVGNMIKEALNK